jgi:signal transduction histidine kinase
MTYTLRKQIPKEKFSISGQREYEALKNTFVALVSHELRTPMSIMDGYLELSLELINQESDPELFAFLTSARDNSLRLCRIVQELTDFSRVQNSAVLGQSTQVTINESIGEVLELFNLYIKSKEIQISVNIPKYWNAVTYESEALLVIFRNLLSNSIKFSPNKSQISISAAEPQSGDLIQFDITDNSPPIPMDKRKNIFDDFQQIENYMTRRYEGMGLGLAVARRYARLLGGDILLNVRENGNTFSVSLP